MLFTGAQGHHDDCMKTMYGCCDDGFTPRTNPYGKGCPVCEDGIPELCEPHISDCNEAGMVGNWMRINCKKTCEVCTPTPQGKNNILKYFKILSGQSRNCLLYTSPSPRDKRQSRMPSSA